MADHMAEQNAAPLTDDERAELEALRAEKARRERAELEELRAERASAKVSAAPRPAPPSPKPAPAPRPASKQVPCAPAEGERTFGQRMVLSDSEDDDGLPTMPPAQKIIIVVCILAVIAAIVYVVGTNTGIAG